MRIGESLLSLAVLSSTSDTFSPVSGLMSVTIFSKSRITTNFPSSLITPVAALLSSVLIVESGLMMSSHDTLWIPITSSTWNAMFNLLKFVIMNKPFFSDGSIPRHFFRSITVIIVSRGIKIPSTQGCAFGTGVTC